MISILLMSALAFAQGRPPMDSCREDLAKVCAGSKPGPEALRCLGENETKLSDPCKQDLQRLRQIMRSAGGRGGGGLGSFGGISGGLNMFSAPVPILVYGGTLEPENRPTSVENQRLNFSTPVYRDGSDTYTVSLAGSNLKFGENLRHPETGAELSRSFSKIELGAGFSRNLEGERMMGFRLGWGSASDKPFANGRDVTYNLNTFYSYPTSEGERWILFLFMSNNTTILNNIPIPGFVYIYKTDHFTGLFGLPFLSLQWTPVDPWGFSLSFFGPVFNSEVTYGNPGEVQYVLGFGWSPQSYMLADRADERDRLFVDELRSFVGIRAPLHRDLAGELQVGSAFRRSIYEARSVFSRDENPRLELGDTWFMNWNLRYAF